MNPDATNKSIVLFDGVCNLCNRAVDRIIRHDPKDRFRFCALQSESGLALAKEFKIDTKKIDSIVLIENNRYYVRSSAALKIARNMSGFYPLLVAGFIFPPFIRDNIYNWIAKNRYKWFGKRDTCRVPTAGEQQKFI